MVNEDAGEADVRRQIEHPRRDNIITGCFRAQLCAFRSFRPCDVRNTRCQPALRGFDRPPEKLASYLPLGPSAMLLHPAFRFTVYKIALASKLTESFF